MEDFYLSYKPPEDKSQHGIEHYLDYLYFSTQIQGTLGFGDIAPKTEKFRFLVMIQSFISFIIINIET